MKQFEDREINNENENSEFDIDSIFAREVSDVVETTPEPVVKYDIDSILSDEVIGVEETEPGDVKRFDIDSLLGDGVETSEESDSTVHERFDINQILDGQNVALEEDINENAVRYDIDNVMAAGTVTEEETTEEVREFDESLLEGARVERIPENVELSEEDLKKAEEEKEQRREIKRQYEADMDAWRNKCEEISKQRNEKVNALLLVEKDHVSRTYKDQYDELFRKNFAIVKEQTKRKADAEQIIPTLGVFQNAEKKAQTAIVEEATKMIFDAQAEIKKAETEYKDSFIVVESILRSKETEIRKQVEAGLQMPEEPEKPSFWGTDSDDLTREERIVDAFLNFVADGDRYSVKEIAFGVSGSCQATEDEVNEVGVMLEAAGRVKREELQQGVYFTKVRMDV